MKRLLNIILVSAAGLLGTFPPTGVALASDVDGSGLWSAYDCVLTAQAVLGVAPAGIQADVNGDGFVSATDLAYCYWTVLGLRPDFDESIVHTTVGGTVPAPAGTNVNRVSAWFLDGVTVEADAMSVPCSPAALDEPVHTVETRFEVGALNLAGPKLQVQVDTTAVDPTCAAKLGPCLDAPTNCAGPCHTGACVATDGLWSCERHDTDVCIACPDGTTANFGTCEPDAPTGGASPLLYWPLADSGVAQYTYDGHPQGAIDIGAGFGTPIGAPISGTVVAVWTGCTDNMQPLWGQSPNADCNSGIGNGIKIVSYDGTITIWLMHLKEGSLYFGVGDTVCAGEQIGLSGSSGNVSSTSGGWGAHLHVGCQVNGVFTYPANLWIDRATHKLGSICPDPPAESCGDGILQNGEACDGSDLGGVSCTDLGLGTGNVGCNSDCTLDTTACVPCTAGASTTCVGLDLYDVDSCGDRGAYLQRCSTSTQCRVATCEAGACGTVVAPNGTTCPGGTCSAASCVPTCQCSSGPCCSDGCHFDATSRACQTQAQVEFSCPWGTTCGADVARRTQDRMCSGSSSACTGSYSSWSSWTTVDNCTATEVCSPGASSCAGSSSCCTSNYCKNNGRTSGTWCDGNSTVTCGSSGGCAVELSRSSCASGTVCSSGTCQCNNFGQTCIFDTLVETACNVTTSTIIEECACGCNASIDQCNACGPAQVIVDDGDATFTRSSGIYWWYVSDHTGFLTRAYNGDIRYTFGGGDGSYTARWKTPSTLTGRYAVYYYRPSPDGFDPNPSGVPDAWTKCTSVQARVVHDGAPSGQTVNINQNGSAGWMLIGTYDFSNRYGDVVFNDIASPSTCAVAMDAIRWLRQ